MASYSQPIGLSTAWNGPGDDPNSLLDGHRALGFRRLEAYAHFTAAQLRALAAMAQERGMELASLHAPCPVPTDERLERLPWGDPLASTDEDERAFAVDALRRTIDAAAEVGARAVVVHLGNTGIVSRQREVSEAITRHGRGSEAHRRLLDEVWRERATAAAPHLDAALRSIRALGQHAAGTPVRLGVETRDGYHEIPSLEEMAEVLAACEGLPVGYWHDAGHGAKLEHAGFWAHEEYLHRYGERLVGMHVHDILRERDHLAPGLGETDFGMLAGYLQARPEAIRTLELARVNTPEQIARALALLGEFEGDPYGVLSHES